MIKVSEVNIFNIKSVPDKWRICKLEDAVNIVGGSQPPKKNFKSELTEGYVRLIQIRDYKSDKYLTFVPKNSTKKFCTKDDIMIGRYGPPVFQILRGLEGAYNVALMKAEPKKNMDSEYLFHLLSSPPVQNLVIGNSKRTAGQTGVNLKLLNNCLIPLPPLPQQQKIANILDAADALRQNDKALLAKYDELTKALFLDMFGDLVNDKIIELGVVIKLIGGGTPSKMVDEYWNGTIPWASVKDLKADILSSTIDHISEEGVNNSATNIIPAGSLIIATRMAVGKTVICAQDTAINQDLKAVKITGEANVKYLQHLFKSKESYFDSVSSGATVKGIKIEHITKLKVPFPSIELQNQFAERVALIEEQKAIAQASLIKSEELFNSLLKKAFKGELA